MHLLRGLHNPGVAETGCVATIGNFDGIHKGHQSIIERVIAKANTLDLPSLVLVFEPQPLEFFKDAAAPARLTSFREKYERLAELGLDYLCCLRFDRTFARYSADDFILEVLVKHLRTKHLVVGDDFRFGGDRLGDFALLNQAGEKFGFNVENTQTLIAESDKSDHVATRVSSTLVRKALSKGDFKSVTRHLGHPYSIKGRVMHGQKLGRTLGFPTANVALKRRVSPLHGVYAVRMRVGAHVHAGVANVGVKPTLGHSRPNLEVHLFDFEGDLYGANVQVEFVAKLREEQRFSGLDALKEQIASDVKAAKAALT
jgi:riboflavin kinase/FMN adenylyltransferase